MLANCATSYGSNIGNWFRALGTKGLIHVEPAFSYEGLRIKVQAQGAPSVEEATDDPSPRQFMREADHLAECILENQEPKTPGEEGLRDEKLITAIYRSCVEHRPIKV